MRNRRNLLYVLIPLIIVLLVLIAGVIYLKLNSTPEKIFTNTINNVFGMLETSKEQFSTMRGTMSFTASAETDSEAAISSMLEGTSIKLDMQADTKNMIINENINVTVDNEDFLNAAFFLQDQKGYVYLKDYLDKYLELPVENTEYSALTNYYKDMETLDQDALIQAIKEEFISALSNQEFVQENETLVLDGQATNVTASRLNLQGQANLIFAKEFLTNLKANEKFLTALGTFKDDTITLIDSMLTNENARVEDIHFVFTIYTKGFLNEFVGVSAKILSEDYYEGYTELEILKHNESKYEIISYEGQREEAKLTIEDIKENKNKGKATITMMIDDEVFVATYSYEKQRNHKSFVLATEVDNVEIILSGNSTENGNNINGNFTISVQEESFGKVDLNCIYDFAYGVEIQKVDVQNAVLIDELTEEDKNIFITNIQDSPLYKLIEQSGLLDSGTENFDAPEVADFGFTVKYNVPNGFEVSEFSFKNNKMYIDDYYNSIDVTIDYNTVDNYLKDLEDEYIMTSNFYKNQKISDEKSMNINGKEYKFRTITYNDEYGSYVNLYFAYELDDEYCYIVEVESEGGNISMDIIKQFLDVTLLEDNMESIVSNLEQSTNNTRQEIINSLNI